MLKASLDWINSIAFPNAGFDHPNDENKVKCAARALDKMGVVIDSQEVIDYCRELGMPMSTIRLPSDIYNIFLLPSSIFTTFIRHPGIGPLLAFSLQN